MTPQNCLSCRKPKATLACEVCQEPVCKDCVQFLEASTFSFLKTLPPELGHTYYCSFCYDSKVAPALENYLAIQEKARGVYVFFTTQRKAIPLIRKSKEVVKIAECADRDETVMRLAFFAAEGGYNAIIEVELICEKVRNHAWHTSRWQGTGLPAEVDAVKVERFSSSHKRLLSPEE